MKISSASDNSQKIGRPINCFMAYRLEKSREITSRSPGLNHRDISKIIAKWWKAATEIEKAPYRAIAAKAKIEHAQKYPNYKFQPVKRKERKVRPYRRRENNAEYEQQIKNYVLNQWLGKETDSEEEMDCKSVASFSCSSISSCSMNTQIFVNEVPIKLETVSMDNATFLPASCVHQTTLHDYDSKFPDATPDCAFQSTNDNPLNYMTNNLSSLDYFDTSNFVNLSIPLLDNLFML